MRYGPLLPEDHEVFRRSRHSRWSIRSEEYEMVGDEGGIEMYASHRRCPQTSSVSMRIKHNWSWFVNDSTQECFGCGAAVPEYIQALVRLQMWR